MGHIHNRASFTLRPSHFILSGAISSSPPLFPSSILDAFRPRGLILICPRRHIFLSFIQLMRFSRQVYWSGLPFPPPVDYLLSELPAMTCPSWVALHSMSHSFIELYMPHCHNKAVIPEGVYIHISFLFWFSTPFRLPQSIE